MKKAIISFFVLLLIALTQGIPVLSFRLAMADLVSPAFVYDMIAMKETLVGDDEQQPLGDPTGLVIYPKEIIGYDSDKAIKIRSKSQGMQLVLSVIYDSGQSRIVDPTALPKDMDVHFVTSDPKKVQVSDTGFITPEALTYYTPAIISVDCIIKVEKDGEEKSILLSADRKISVIQPADSIYLKYKLKTIYEDKVVDEKTNINDGASFDLWIGDKMKLYPTVLPEDTTDKTVNFKSSNTDTATVSDKGVVKIKNLGDATISASPADCPEVSIHFEIHCYKTKINVVKDLGAVPNDGKSDLKTIKKAMSQAKYLNKGDRLKVTVPKGTYDIDGTIVAFSDTTLKLAKKAVIKRTVSAGSKTMLISKNNKKIKGYEQFKNFKMSGGMWNGNAHKNGSSNLVYFGHGKNISIKNTTIKNTCGEHLIELSGIYKATIKNVRLRGYKKPKKQNQYTSKKEAIQLDYCSSSTAPYMKPYDHTACKKITISGCEIKNYMCGIGSHGYRPGVSLKKIRIVNNRFENITNICIDARKFKKLVVKNNKAIGINEFFFGEKSTGTIKHNTLRKKTFKKKTKKRLNAPNGIELLRSRFTIRSNKIIGQKANGICIGTGSKATVTKNSIRKSKKYGIYTYRAKVKFKKNRFYKNKKASFHTDVTARVKKSDDIRAYPIKIKRVYRYTGRKIKPVKRIRGLAKKYYTIRYKHNRKKGKATIIIKGRNGVKKKRKLRFRIKR